LDSKHIPQPIPSYTFPPALPQLIQETHTPQCGFLTQPQRIIRSLCLPPPTLRSLAPTTTRGSADGIANALARAANRIAGTLAHAPDGVADALADTANRVADPFTDAADSACHAAEKA